MPSDEPRWLSGGYAASDLIDWTEDPVTGAIVRSWPAHVDAPRAKALGLHAETSFDDIVRAYLEDRRGTRKPSARL